MELLIAPYHEVDQSFWSEIRELKLRGNGRRVQCWARGNTQGSRGSSSVLSSLLSGSMTHPKGLGAGTTATETTTTHHALVSYFAVFAAISTLEAHLNEISQKRKAKVGWLWSQLHVISGPILYGLRAPERPQIRWDEVASRNGREHQHCSQTAKHVEA
ncbi:hypothetical protein NEUTE1DRAFT_98341 [Neurospora tetrasperma FGSC 2508]|uniref:Uncharacterized protein n=1 Tax=Neurospora tetrasperma (strain FGSC 2508 / ATCC MYA-4615 / P0657) TaxID=510951 RepID=F8MBZ7_NEUT8|nr:uncharacterized protein NEUTE1DRAFT_98341 [Neurospora tetrasperma FGSC 2508]EGO61206.1 hypothetical protein NEUTE1DRAFT_98341 [Neurospora tetrasperma FGSC 2508]